MKHKDTFQAWTCHDFDHHANLKITEELLKPPREDEVLIKVAAFAPGFPDMLMVNGKHLRLCRLILFHYIQLLQQFIMVNRFLKE